MPTIAYFTAEIGLWSELHTYSGGLGVLAGDHVKSAADANLPLVAISLLYREGYGRQHLDAKGDQSETRPSTLPNTWSTPGKPSSSHLTVQRSTPACGEPMLSVYRAMSSRSTSSTRSTQTILLNSSAWVHGSTVEMMTPASDRNTSWG